MPISRIQFDELLTEDRMLASLANGEIHLPGIGIQVRGVQTHVPTTQTTDIQADAVVDVSWQSKTFPFFVECKAQSTPKLAEAAIGQVIYYARVTGLNPMIFLPYLSPKALERLEASGVSGID